MLKASWCKRRSLLASIVSCIMAALMRVDVLTEDIADDRSCHVGTISASRIYQRHLSSLGPCNITRADNKVCMKWHGRFERIGSLHSPVRLVNRGGSVNQKTLLFTKMLKSKFSPWWFMDLSLFLCCGYLEKLLKRPGTVWMVHELVEEGEHTGNSVRSWGRSRLLDQVATPVGHQAAYYSQGYSINPGSALQGLHSTQQNSIKDRSLIAVVTHQSAQQKLPGP